jgi:hypothetical protein
VPGHLEAPQRQQLDEVADVQPGRGRVEADINRDHAGIKRFAQLVQVGGQRDQAAPAQLVDDVGHGCIVPPVRGGAVTVRGLRRRGTAGR